MLRVMRVIYSTKLKFLHTSRQMTVYYYYSQVKLAAVILQLKKPVHKIQLILSVDVAVLAGGSGERKEN